MDILEVHVNVLLNVGEIFGRSLNVRNALDIRFRQMTERMSEQSRIHKIHSRETVTSLL